MFIIRNKLYQCVVAASNFLIMTSLCFLQADAGVLQLQNQQLVQQTEVQKQAIQDLEEKTKELKERQNSYDDILIAINQHWDQVIVYYQAPVFVDSALYSFCYFFFQM